MTTSPLPVFGRQSHGGGLHKRMPGSDEKSFGVMVNSFFDLDSFRNELGNTAWIGGPVSLCNRNVEDKGREREAKRLQLMSKPFSTGLTVKN